MAFTSDVSIPSPTDRFEFRHSTFVIDSSFGFVHSSFPPHPGCTFNPEIAAVTVAGFRSFTT